MRSSRSDPLAPSLTTLGSESDRQCPPLLIKRNQLPLLPKSRGAHTGTQARLMRSCSPHCKAIQSRKRINQNPMHDFSS